MEKQCSNCKLKLDYNQFSNCKKAKDKKQSWCKSCKLQQLNLYYSKYPHKRSKAKRTKEQSLARYYKNRISQNFSRRMRQSLNSTKKTSHWEKLVDYSLQDLKIHLEKLFTPEMTWENYGHYWHIDHIRPVNSFNITSLDCDGFKECWALNNLQPLKVLDNLKKGAKYRE